ncbi:hypothetical protein RFI_13034, partial [Reticulomyxa filosa]
KKKKKKKKKKDEKKNENTRKQGKLNHSEFHDVTVQHSENADNNDNKQLLLQAHLSDNNQALQVQVQVQAQEDVEMTAEREEKSPQDASGHDTEPHANIPKCSVKKWDHLNHQKIPQESLVCACGGQLTEKWSKGGEVVACFFCELLHLPANVRYYECDAQSPMHPGGFSGCTRCVGALLVDKFWDPQIYQQIMKQWQHTLATADSSAQVKGKYPHMVGTKVHIERVAEVDTQSQSFRSKLKIFLTWKPTKADLELWESNPDEFHPQWEPRLEFPNIIEEHTREWIMAPSLRIPFFVVEKGECNRGNISPLPYSISACLLLDATFSEVFELENFPG